jgi:hypothetical protein
MKLKSLLVSLFSLLALGAFSAEAIVVNGIAYVIQSSYSSYHNGNLCYITERPDGQKYEGDIVIPERVNLGGKDCLIVGVGDKAFKDCTGLNSVTFQGILEWIGNSAFEGCTNLHEFTIPPFYSNNMYSGDVKIGSHAFRGCHLTTLISKIAIPPYYDWSNPSYFSMSGFSTAGWFSHDWDDRWYYDHIITLYVPAGSIAAYSKKSKDEYYSDDIHCGSGYDRDWGNLIGRSIKEIKEYGVDADDETPELYERISQLKDICKQQQVIGDSLSDIAYHYFIAGLYDNIISEGDETSTIEAKIKEYDDYFEWVEIKDEWSGETRLFPYIPELYRIVNGIATSLDKAEEGLNDLSGPRFEYYKMKREYESLQAKAEEARIKAENAQEEAESSQDEDKKMLAQALMYEYQNIKADVERIKKELDGKASELYKMFDEIHNLVYSAANQLSYIMENDVLKQKYEEFFSTLKDAIASVPAITAGVNKKAEQWYSPDGRSLSQKPTKAGLYIINGKKLIVK